MTRIVAETGVFSTAVDQVLGRIIDLRPALEVGVERWSRMVAEEINGRFWRPPSGPKRSWKDTHRFGNFTPATPTFGRKYLAAWRGGPGGFRQIRKTGATFGVSLREFPWAKYHRGGTGAIRAQDVAAGGYRVKPKKLARGATNATPSPQRWAMWWFLGINREIWLKKTTIDAGLFVPFRPHATANPEIRTIWAAIVSAYVTGRRLPPSALS